MSKTYLQLVNKVLVNLRQPVVTDLSATYTQLIGEFVNQAKETVEDSWRWRALSTVITFTTVLNQVTYQLTSTASPAAASTGNFPDERSFVLKDDRGNAQAFDITQVNANVLYQLKQVPREAIVGDIYLAPARTTNLPWAYAYSTEGGTPTIYLADPPPASRNLAIRFCVPQPEFSAGTEVVQVPWRPIVSLATFNAMQERGEELGTSADLYNARYNSELLRAQELDRDSAYDQLMAPDTGSGYLTWNT